MEEDGYSMAPVEKKTSGTWGWLLVIGILVILVAGGTFGYNYYSSPKLISENSRNVVSCTDTDGDDIYVKGYNDFTMVDPDSNEEDGRQYMGSVDYCDYHHPKTDRRVGLIREGICDGATYKDILRTCGGGYVCRNGACIKGNENIGICFDSDNGKNTNERGSIVGYGGSGRDECWVSADGINGGSTNECGEELVIAGQCYVNEWYCDGDNKANEKIKCPNGCLNGVCL